MTYKNVRLAYASKSAAKAAPIKITPINAIDFFVAELSRVQGVLIKHETPNSVVADVSGKSSKVKHIEIENLNQNTASFKLVLRNGLSGAFWHVQSQRFTMPSASIKMDVLFKKGDLAVLRSVIKNMMDHVEMLDIEPVTMPGLQEVLDGLKTYGYKMHQRPGWWGGGGYAIENADQSLMVTWKMKDEDTVFWSATGVKNNPYTHFGGHHGDMPLRKKMLNNLVDTIKKALDEISVIMAEKKIQEEAAAKLQGVEQNDHREYGEKIPYSVVITSKANGYVTEVFTFDTKGEAIEEAKSLGGAYVLKGTQMWNEPLGQIEESDRAANFTFHRDAH